MEGGLFGLTQCQMIFLYINQLIPTLIVIMVPDLVESLFLTQVFYVLATFVYIKFVSIEKSFFPYLLNELNRLKWQLNKGFILGFSAFLLITIYGALFLKIGKVVLP